MPKSRQIPKSAPAPVLPVPVDRFPNWTPKEGDKVTTDLALPSFGGELLRCNGIIKTVKQNPRPDELPYQVKGFWFEKHQLTPVSP